MNDEPKIILKTESDSLAQAAQGEDFASAESLNWRRSGAQQKGAGDPNLVERLTDDASLESFEICGYVRQFRHAPS